MMEPKFVSIERRFQWVDTDAAGIWHHSVVIGWAEEAEAELHRRLGIIDETFGAIPRVRVEFEFASLRPNDRRAHRASDRAQEELARLPSSSPRPVTTITASRHHNL